MNILFACDLDNTLLYSFKHKQDGDVCIELLKDKEQGFMSQKACALLSEVVNEVNFIPVTTRSIEQYSRIAWTKNVTPQYAATTNGAILLDRYNKDDNWFKVSESYSKPVHDEQLRLQRFLMDQNRFIRCRIVDDMYLFAYCKDGIDAKKCVSEYKSLTSLSVVSSGKKIYFFPAEINKGTAVTRLKELFNPDLVICAGDSSIDIPMLDIADVAIVPSSSLAARINSKKVYINDGSSFSEYVLETVLNIANKN